MTGTHEIEPGDGRTPKPRANNVVDNASDDSFPASDPPASTGVSGSGAPAKNKNAAPAAPPPGKAAAQSPDGTAHFGKWIGTALMAVAATVTLTKLQRKSRRH